MGFSFKKVRQVSPPHRVIKYSLLSNNEPGDTQWCFEYIRAEVSYCPWGHPHRTGS